MMDSPRPAAAIALWKDAPGRKRVELPVPGAMLRGYSYIGKAERGPVLLMFGGSGNLIKNHDAAARGFAQHASRVVFYDYRGYGFSSGTAHFDDLRADALRIYDATLAGSTNKRVVVLGYSMGTDIAEYLATNRNVAGLILAAPWSDTKAMVRRIDAPLLVFQGTRDDRIPTTQGPRLEREAASADKRFVAIVGAKHNGLLENPQAQAAVGVFLQHVMNL
jgi:pimeloyl-ACP methyl ester carboxylesterase